MHTTKQAVYFAKGSLVFLFSFQNLGGLYYQFFDKKVILLYRLFDDSIHFGGFMFTNSIDLVLYVTGITVA